MVFLIELKYSGQDSYEDDYEDEEEDYYQEHEDYESAGDYDGADYEWEQKWLWQKDLSKYWLRFYVGFNHSLPLISVNNLWWFGIIGSELLSRSEYEDDYEDDYEEDCGEDDYCTYSEVTSNLAAVLAPLLTPR